MYVAVGTIFRDRVEGERREREREKGNQGQGFPRGNRFGEKEEARGAIW